MGPIFKITKTIPTFGKLQISQHAPMWEPYGHDAVLGHAWDHEFGSTQIMNLLF